MGVGHDIESCTSKLSYAILTNDGRLVSKDRRIVVLDTPGFDDTYEADGEILRRISVWLASSYEDGMTLGGVVYLQNISENRMKGATRRNMEMFRELCGEGAREKVILGTTHWGLVPDEVGQRREKQVAERFWTALEGKAVDVPNVLRFLNTQDSAQNIIGAILKNLDHPKAKGEQCDSAALLFQRELVDLHRYIPETKAGKELRRQLQEMQKDMARDSDPASFAAKREKVLQQLKDLKIPLSRQILAFFGLS